MNSTKAEDTLKRLKEWLAREAPADTEDLLYSAGDDALRKAGVL